MQRAAPRATQFRRNFAARAVRDPAPDAMARLCLPPPARAPNSSGPRSCAFLYRVEPAEMDRETLARQQRRSLVQRQPDDVGVGAGDLDDEAAGEPLRGVAAGLAAPFT